MLGSATKHAWHTATLLHTAADVRGDSIEAWQVIASCIIRAAAVPFRHRLHVEDVYACHLPLPQFLGTAVYWQELITCNI